MQKKEAFTLIELVIATGILTITVFGIYKLISENLKVINNSNTKVNAALLFPTIETCLENSGLTKDNNTQIGDTNGIYLGNDLKKCEISNKLTKIDNIEYSLKIKKITENTWETSINSDYTGTLTGNYIQKE